MGPEFAPQININGKCWNELPVFSMQCKVYVCKDEVLKILLPPEQVLERAKKNPYVSHWDIQEAQNWNKFSGSRILGVKERIESGKIDKSIMAEATIDNELRIYQEKVSMVGELAEAGKISDIEMKKVIDQFIELNEKLWNGGVYEKEFSLFTNCGINKNGDLALVDFGLVSFEYEEAKKSVDISLSFEEAVDIINSENEESKERLPSWLRGQVVNIFKCTPDLLEYYFEQMSVCMSVENLESRWPKENIKIVRQN